MQTFQPDATPLRYAARHDVAGFLAEELERRRELGYPPFRHLSRSSPPAPTPPRRERLLRELSGGSRAPTCSARRRCCACAAATGLSSSRRPIARARSRRGRRRLLAAAAPAMRRAGVTAVVDVDPQSLSDKHPPSDGMSPD